MKAKHNSLYITNKFAQNLPFADSVIFVPCTPSPFGVYAWYKNEYCEQSGSCCTECLLYIKVQRTIVYPWAYCIVVYQSVGIQRETERISVSFCILREI